MATTTTQKSILVDENTRKLRNVVSKRLRMKEDPEKLRWILTQYGFKDEAVDFEIERQINFQQTGTVKPLQTTQPAGEFSSVLQSSEASRPLEGVSSRLLADGKTSLQMVDNLKTVIGSEDFGPVEGTLSGMNPYDTSAKDKQSQLKTTMQLVGKFMEGGVLRKEDEVKYAEMLPKLSDTPEVAKAKMENVREMLSNKMKNDIASYSAAGFDVSAFAQDMDATFKKKDETGAQASQATPVDQQAIEWLKANPTDPRAEKVRAKLQSKGLLQSQNLGDSAAPESGVEAPKEQGFLSTLGKEIPELAGKVLDRFSNAYSDVQGDMAKGNLPTLTGRSGLRAAGAIGGSINDAFTSLIEVGYSALPKETKDVLKDTALTVAKSDVGQAGLSAFARGAEEWQQYKAENPERAKDIEDVANVLAAIPAGKILGKVKGETKAVTKDTLQVLGRSNETKATTEVFKAIKPSITVGRNLSTAKDTVGKANKAIIDLGIKAPTNVREYTTALTEAKQKVWQQIERKLAGAGTTKVDIGTIADRVKQMADDPNLLRIDQRAASKLANIARSLESQGREMSVADAESLKQYINSELKGAFGKFNLSNAEQNAKKMITAEIGKQLDDILSSVPNEFSDMKKLYGAVRQTEEDALKRLVVFERQNPQGLIESYSKISGVGNIIKGVATLNPSEVVKGASEVIMGQVQRRANDADTLIKKAFERLDTKKGGFDSWLFNTVKDIKGKGGLSLQDVSGGKAGYSDDLLQEARKYKSAQSEANDYAKKLGEKYNGRFSEMTSEESTTLSKLNSEVDRLAPKKAPKTPSLPGKNTGTSEDIITGTEYFHATTPDRLNSIIKDGLSISQKARGVNGGGQVFVADTPRHALGFMNDLKLEGAISEGTDPILLRVRDLPHEKLTQDVIGRHNSLSSGTAWSYSDNVPAKYLEIKKDGKWIPLTDLWKKAHGETKRGFGTGAGRMKNEMEKISLNVGEVYTKGKKIKESILNELADFTEYAAKQKQGIKIERIPEEIRARAIAEKLGVNPDVSNWMLSKKFGKLLKENNWDR